MGTPTFATPVLAALLDAGHDVVGVYTQPDKPVGRGGNVEPSPVKQFALERKLSVHQPERLRDGEVRLELEALLPDVCVVAAYGKLLPSELLMVPPFGCINIHPSLLPRYRGPSPVPSAILAGCAVTGVTVMKLDQGMDTGPLLAYSKTVIIPNEKANALILRLFEMGSDLLVKVLAEIEAGKVIFKPQDDARATMTKKLSKEDGLVDWVNTAEHITRQVRAFHPWPGTFTYWRGKRLKIIDAIAQESAKDGRVGEVLGMVEDGLQIVTGNGVLEITRLQEEGRKVVSAKQFVAGHADVVGAVFGLRG